MEVIQPTTAEHTRAKEIDTGAIPLPMENVLLGLPVRPTTTVDTDKTAVAVKSWTWEEIVGQDRIIADLNVDTNSSGNIFMFRNTWNNVQKSIFRNLDKLFTLKSWTINLKFEFRSNFQQVGQFVVFFSNMPPTLYDFHFGNTSPFSDYATMTQLPHRKIPMGEDVNLIVQLKWLSPFKSGFANGFYLTDDEPGNDAQYDMGTLYLAVPYKMECATGVVANTTVRVWASLSDVTYSGYAPLDTVI